MVFSKDLEGIDLSGFIENSKQILRKGAPDGKGSGITKWSAESNRLDLQISSERYVRPHEAIFRLKNFLSAELGRGHHIGIREIHASAYEIEFETDLEPKRKFSIPFAKELNFEGKNCKIFIENLSEEFLQKNYVDRMITLINDKINAQHYEGKEEYWEVIWQSEKKKHLWNSDPTKEMEKRKWIMHRGRGQWIFGPIAAKIMRTMEEIVIDELIKPLNFNEVIIPKAVTWDVWKKSGHAKKIYNEIYYLCQPVTREQEFWEDVVDTYKITNEIPLELIKSKIKEPIGGISYAQCPPFWPYLDGKTLADESLPIKVFDRSGPSMRYESGGIHGIERVDEFHRVEVIWLGYPEQVRDLHKNIVEQYKKIFNEILDLEWRMAWVTPWFMQQEGLIGLADEKKDIGTIDFEAYLPYRGSRDESEWLEFQNASNNGDKYPKGFNVKSQSGEDFWSGCTGIGLERWTASFLAQKGLEPENWPKEFRKRIGKMPEGIKFL